MTTKLRTNFPDNAARLGAVALAAGAVAFPGVADASAVVYSVAQPFPASVNFTPSTGAVGLGETLMFSLAGNGPEPMLFQLGTISGSGANLVATDDTNSALKLASGMTIDSSLFGNGSHSANVLSNVFFPSLKFSTPYFIGLDAIDPSTSKNYYGYAAFDGTNTITSYAFETLPDTPITAGATPTADVPEPCSLALLALGAAGVVSLRRRQQAA